MIHILGIFCGVSTEEHQGQTMDYIINIGKHLKNILILEESFLQITIDLYMIRPKILIWLATKIVDYILAKNSGQAAFTHEKLLN